MAGVQDVVVRGQYSYGRFGNIHLRVRSVTYDASGTLPPSFAAYARSTPPLRITDVSVELPRYGLYGGPGYTGGIELDLFPDRVGSSFNAEPIDDLDALFANHDFGYGEAEGAGTRLRTHNQ